MEGLTNSLDTRDYVKIRTTLLPGHSSHPYFCINKLAPSGLREDPYNSLSGSFKPSLLLYQQVGAIRIMFSTRQLISKWLTLTAPITDTDVARELGLPLIILRSSSAVFFPAMIIIPQLYQEGRFPIQDSLLWEIVRELDPFRYKDLPFIGRPIKETLQSITMIIPKTPSAIVWNTIEFLEQSALTHIRNHYQVSIFTIGPLHKIIPTPSTSFLEEDTSCISWLDKQAPKSVIYVSIGSLANADEKVATEMAWGLVNSNHLFLWVVRPGYMPGFKWTKFFPDGLVAQMKDRGLIVKWAPQKEVLAHNSVGGFWSHCGWNSTLESVEIAIKSAEIESAIRLVLVGKEAEEMRQRASEIQEQIKFALCGGNSSDNSRKDLVNFILSL
nr:UDP-glycosyltransferase 76H1-like [Tanacetum cinerariifolium]